MASHSDSSITFEFLFLLSFLSVSCGECARVIQTKKIFYPLFDILKYFILLTPQLNQMINPNG